MSFSGDGLQIWGLLSLRAGFITTEQWPTIYRRVLQYWALERSSLFLVAIQYPGDDVECTDLCNRTPQWWNALHWDFAGWSSPSYTSFLDSPCSAWIKRKPTVNHCFPLDSPTPAPVLTQQIVGENNKNCFHWMSQYHNDFKSTVQSAW